MSSRGCKQSKRRLIKKTRLWPVPRAKLLSTLVRLRRRSLQQRTPNPKPKQLYNRKLRNKIRKSKTNLTPENKAKLAKIPISLRRKRKTKYVSMSQRAITKHVQITNVPPEKEQNNHSS